MVAYEVVRRTFEEGAYADRAFPAEAEKAKLDERDRRLAMRLAYGTVQRVRTLDYAMEALASRPPGQLQPTLRAALRLGAYQILFAGGIPDRAAVNETVELAKAVAGRHTAGLANAVLRRVAEAGPEWVETLRPALRHSYPDWIAGEWTAMFGETEAAALMAAQNEPPELAVRVNTLRPGPLDLGVARTRRSGAARGAGARRALRRGREPRAGRGRHLAAVARIDAGGAPARPGARHARARPVLGAGRQGRPAGGADGRPRRARLRRAPPGPGRSTRAHTALPGCDLREASSWPTRSSSPRRGSTASCSTRPAPASASWPGGPMPAGGGTLADARDLAGLQRQLLDHARGLLAAGGRLVYSVCTIRRDECAGVVPGGRQTLPHRDHTDGFYIAVAAVRQSTTVAPMRSWPQDVQVAPSILSSDFGRMREQVSEVMEAGARVIHIDVMDGHFVPVITFGPKMMADIAEVIRSYDGFADVHLMIEQPERHLSQFAEAGADSITVHIETCPHVHRTLQLIHELGCRAGVTLNPGTPVEAIAEAARYADVLLCMSVNPGWGGQKFIPATLDRLPQMRALAAAREGVAVEVDGGIHAATIAAAHRAGANILVAGSAIFGAASPAEAYRDLADGVAVAGAHTRP